MIPINPTLKLVLFVVLVGIAAGLGALLKLEPTWTWLAGVIAVLGYVEGYLTPSPKQVPAPPAKLLAAGLIFLGFSAHGVARLETAYRSNPKTPAPLVVAWNTRAALRLAATLLVAIGVALFAACTPAAVVAATPAVATTAACIITTSAEDVQAGMPAVQVVEDVIAKCATDAASIATILDAEAKAQTIAGGKLGDVATAAHARDAGK